MKKNNNNNKSRAFEVFAKTILWMKDSTVMVRGHLGHYIAVDDHGNKIVAECKSSVSYREDKKQFFTHFSVEVIMNEYPVLKSSVDEAEALEIHEMMYELDRVKCYDFGNNERRLMWNKFITVIDGDGGSK